MSCLGYHVVTHHALLVAFFVLLTITFTVLEGLLRREGGHTGAVLIEPELVDVTVEGVHDVFQRLELLFVHQDVQLDFAFVGVDAELHHAIQAIISIWVVCGRLVAIVNTGAVRLDALDVESSRDEHTQLVQVVVRAADQQDVYVPATFEVNALGLRGPQVTHDTACHPGFAHSQCVDDCTNFLGQLSSVNELGAFLLTDHSDSPEFCSSTTSLRCNGRTRL